MNMNNSNPTPQNTEDSETEPLVGLLPKGRPLTEEELRAFVVQNRNYRQSHQTFRAAVEATAPAKAKSAKVQVVKNLDELLGE